MTNEITVHGIVLSSMPVGEYDRRVTILTAERGRISAFAKGARKPTGAFLACAQGFTYGEFSLFAGRDSYSITGADKLHYFSELRDDMEALYYGMYFCELAGVLTREGLEEPGQMKLLYLALLALTKRRMPPDLIRYTYELRCISIYGEAPTTTGCCYSSRSNGLTDEMQPGGTRVSETTLYTVRHILQTPLKELFGFTVDDDIMLELKNFAESYMDRHIDTKLKTLEMLNIITAK